MLSKLENNVTRFTNDIYDRDWLSTILQGRFNNPNYVLRTGKGYPAKLLFSSTIDVTLLEIEALHTATKCH